MDMEAARRVRRTVLSNLSLQRAPYPLPSFSPFSLKFSVLYQERSYASAFLS